MGPSSSCLSRRTATSKATTPSATATSAHTTGQRATCSGTYPRACGTGRHTTTLRFDTFTYGDNCAISARAAALRRVRPGDLLFFLARLQRRSDHGPDGAHGFYLIGFLEIEEVLREVASRPDDDVLRRFGANAHVRRGLSDSKLWDRFLVFRGSARSRRFDRAVPVTRDLAGRVLTRADGSPWRWDDGRSDLQVIGSYTRSCRCVIDPALPGHAVRAEALWEWVSEYAS